MDLLHIVENNSFDIISRFRISDSKFLLVFYFFYFFRILTLTRCKLSLDILHLLRFIFITFGFLDSRY